MQLNGKNLVIAGLSLADLKVLGVGIDALRRAGDVLAKAGLEPTVSINSRETLLRTAPILGEPDNDGEVIEPETALPRAQFSSFDIVYGSDGRIAEVLATPATEAGDENVACRGVPTFTAEIPERPLAGRAVAPVLSDPAPVSAELRTGPFSEAEKAAALAAEKDGKTPAEIAAELNRGAGPVSLLLARLKKARARKDAEQDAGGEGGSDAPVPPPGKPRAQAGPAASRPAPADECIGSPQGVSNGAQEKRAPGGNQFQTSGTTQAPQSATVDAGHRKPAPASGHPSALAGAETAPAAERSPQVAPPQGAASLPANMAPAPDFCPAELRGIEREVWHMLQALRPDRDFDEDLDLDLVEGLFSGRTLAELALDFGLDAAKLRSRFDVLTAAIRNDRKQIRVDGQPALLKVLRLRLLQSRGNAA